MKIHNTTDRSLRVSGVWIPAGQFRTVRDFDETEPRNARFLAEGFIALDAPEEFEPEPEPEFKPESEQEVTERNSFGFLSGQ